MTTCSHCHFVFEPASTGGTCPRCALAAAIGGALDPEAVDDFEILAELGRGAMGVVSLARQRSLDRLVALKVIATGSRPTEWLEARLLREARASAQLHHPHIVTVHEVGHGPAGAFLAMEYCEGGDLRENLRQRPIAALLAARLGAKLADALAHAHAAGVLHRDLKPSNILLTAAHEPKISDFGLTTAAGGGELTQTGEVAGSPSYLAPEVLLAGSRPAPALDIYGLGAILYECVTGRPPFTGDSTASVLAQIAQAEPAAPRMLNRDIPADLETIILKCLEKRPAARYASAAALHNDLQNFLAGRPITARPVSAPGRFWRWTRRNPGLAGLALTLALTLTGATGLMVVKNRALDAALAQAKSHLTRSLLAQAKAVRQSGRMGQRFEALRLIDQAMLSGSAVEDAGTEALAALALADWRLLRRLPVLTHVDSRSKVDFTPDLAHCVVPSGAGTAPEVRRVADWKVTRQCAPASTAEIEKTGFGPPAGWIWAYYKDETQAVWAPDEDQPKWIYCSSGQAAAPAFAANGSGWWFTGPEHRVGWHDAATGAEHWLGDGGSYVYALSPSADDRLLAVVRDDRLEVWEVAERKMRWSWSGDAGFAPAVWSADGRWLVSDRFTGAPEITVWEARNGHEAQTLRQGQARSSLLALHPDGRRLLSVDSEAVLRVWDRWTGQELVRGPAGTNAMRISTDGKRAAVGTGFQEVGLIEFGPEEIMRTFSLGDVSRERWQSTAVSPDDRWLLGATGAGLRLWSVATGREELHWDFPYSTEASALFAPPDGRVVYSGTKAGAHSRPLRATGQQAPTWGDAQVVAPPDAETITAISADGRCWWIRKHPQGNMITWPDGDPSRAMPVTEADSRGEQVAVAAADGRWLSVTGAEGTDTRVLALPGGNVAATLPTRRLAHSVFSPDSRWLILGTNQGYDIWRTGEWQRPAAVLPMEQPNAIYGHALFTPDSRRLAITTGLGTISISRTGAWQPDFILTLPGGAEVDTWAWSQDGSTLFMLCGQQTVTAWNIPAAEAALARLTPTTPGKP